MPNTGVMTLENEIQVPLADGSKAYVDLVLRCRKFLMSGGPRYH